MKKVPSLNSIRAFEVAARHLNFTNAAKEIGVTPGAVSKQVLKLEDYIGALLFIRSSYGLELTLEGRELKKNISPAFEILNNAFQRYSRRSLITKTVRISTVASLASQFIIPRLTDFKKKFPDIDLELLTSDRVLDLSREEVDIAIRFGQGNWENVFSKKLTKGGLLPVCSPKFLKGESIDNIETFINAYTRIQVFAYDEWKSWGRQLNQNFKLQSDHIHLEHFLVAIQAVVSGQGIALLPEILIRQNIIDGNIVKFSNEIIEIEDNFYIVQSPKKANDKVNQSVVQWLNEIASI